MRKEVIRNSYNTHLQQERVARHALHWHDEQRLEVEPLGLEALVGICDRRRVTDVSETTHAIQAFPHGNKDTVEASAYALLVSSNMFECDNAVS